MELNLKSTHQTLGCQEQQVDKTRQRKHRNPERTQTTSHKHGMKYLLVTRLTSIDRIVNETLQRAA